MPRLIPPARSTWYGGERYVHPRICQYAHARDCLRLCRRLRLSRFRGLAASRLFLRRRLTRLLAAALEGRAFAPLHVPAQRDRRVVRPVDRRTYHQILRRDDAPDRAAKAALELVDAVELLPWLQYIGDGAPVVVVGAVGLDPAHALPLEQVVRAQLAMLRQTR